MNDQSKEPRRQGAHLGTSAAVQEILSRTRRIETRLTQQMVALGYDTDTQKPTFERPVGVGAPARVSLPSPHSSMKEILTSIPEDYTEPVEIFIGTEMVVTVFRKS